MKTKTFKLSIFFLLFALMGASCQKDEYSLWEISPNSKNSVIQKEVDGIEFKFCLLNEQGESSTVFNEGEGFSFYFSVTNNRDEKLNFDPGFAYSKEIDFCKVYNLDNQYLGKPYYFITALDIGAGAYPFDAGKTYVFQQQWADNRDFVWGWEYGTYESAHKEPLPKGKYYTGFKYRFRFARTHEESPLYIDTLHFIINFEIH